MQGFFAVSDWIVLSIEGFLEDQAFSCGRMIWLAPPQPPPHPLPPDNKLERRHTGILRNQDNLPTGEGGGAKSYNR
jgi:hypothetical protein